MTEREDCTLINKHTGRIIKFFYTFKQLREYYLREFRPFVEPEWDKELPHHWISPTRDIYFDLYFRQRRKEQQSNAT